MIECTRCKKMIKSGVLNQIEHDTECKGTEEHPVEYLSETGIDFRGTYRTISQLQEDGYAYCTELGCKEGRHHPECAMNPIEKKNDNWETYPAHSTKESARQRFIYLMVDHKWLILIGLQIILAAILKYNGII